MDAARRGVASGPHLWRHVVGQRRLRASALRPRCARYSFFAIPFPLLTRFAGLASTSQAFLFAMLNGLGVGGGAIVAGRLYTLVGAERTFALLTAWVSVAYIIFASFVLVNRVWRCGRRRATVNVADSDYVPIPSL